MISNLGTTCEPDSKCHRYSSNSKHNSFSGLRDAHRAAQTIQVSDEANPIHFAVSLIHGKWKVSILTILQSGPVRLGHLQRLLPLVSKKVLIQQLRGMETDGLIVRKDLSRRIRHVEYSLSKTRGSAILRLMNALAEWGEEQSCSPRGAWAMSAIGSTVDTVEPKMPETSCNVLTGCLDSTATEDEIRRFGCSEEFERKNPASRIFPQ